MVKLSKEVRNVFKGLINESCYKRKSNVDRCTELYFMANEALCSLRRKTLTVRNNNNLDVHILDRLISYIEYLSRKEGLIFEDPRFDGWHD